MYSYSYILPSYCIELFFLWNVYLNANGSTISVSCSKCSFKFLIFTDLLYLSPAGLATANPPMIYHNAQFFCFTFYLILSFLKFLKGKQYVFCVLHANQMFLTKQRFLPGERGRICVEIFSQMDRVIFYTDHSNTGKFILMALEPSAKGQLPNLVKSLAIFFAVKVAFEIELNLALELQIHMRSCMCRTNNFLLPIACGTFAKKKQFALLQEPC